MIESLEILQQKIDNIGINLISEIDSWGFTKFVKPHTIYFDTYEENPKSVDALAIAVTEFDGHEKQLILHVQDENGNESYLGLMPGRDFKYMNII